jgi:hypothetical protein
MGSARVVVRQQVRLRLGRLRKSFLVGACDVYVQRLPPVARQHCIGCVADECMLENERRLWDRAAAEDQAGRNELIERSNQLCFINARDHAQQFERKFATDHGAGLRDFPAGA